jgi:hypothetical protein
MSNYIDNLIARNQQAAEVVRPRLPSIFEPPVHARTAFVALNLAGPLASPQAASEAINPRAPLAGQAESNAVMANREPSAVESSVEPSSELQTTTASSPEAPMPAWRGIQQLPEKYARTDEGNVSPQPLTPSLAPSIAIHSKINEPSGETSQRRFDTNREIDLSPRPVSPQKSEAAGAERRELPGPQADSQQPPSQTNLPSRRPAHERIAQPLIKEAGRAALSIESSASRIVVQPRGSRRDEHDTTRAAYRSGQERPSFQSPEAPPMPTINVTIGRIEVRALPPTAAPPRPQKTAAPLMSLEEYMRRRNGGGDSV